MWLHRQPSASVRCVVIRSQNTGRTLPAAPEFGRDGTWPNVVAAWVPLQWQLFESDKCSPTTLAAYSLIKENTYGNDLLLTEDALYSDPPYAAIFNIIVSAALVEAKTDIYLHYKIRDLKFNLGGKLAGGTRSGHELRRVVHSVRWQREDPVIQLSPGSTFRTSLSVMTGLTVERSQLLASSLGLGLKGKVTGIQAQLSSQMSQEFGLKLDITAQRQEVRELTLTNESRECYRLFALWHVDHRISVDALDVPIPTARDLGWDLSRLGKYTVDYHSRWVPREEVEFAIADHPFITYAEVTSNNVRS